MLTHNYSYKQCLDNSTKVYWDVDSVLQGKDFDYSKNFLPDSMIGASSIDFLNDDEKLKFNQIAGNSYFHLFQYVEEPIISIVIDAARADVHGDETRLRALLRFAEEETKHQQLFQNCAEIFRKGFGMECGLIEGKNDVAQAVTGAPKLAGLLLVEMLEWITQTHYLEHVRDAGDLDPLFSEILRLHWLEEAQHTKMDVLLLDEAAKDSSLEEREAALDVMLQFCGAVDGLLEQQSQLNIESLAKATGREFTDEQKNALVKHNHTAFRFGLIGLALQHPKFIQTVKELTEQGESKIADAAKVYSPSA